MNASIVPANVPGRRPYWISIVSDQRSVPVT